MARSAFRRRIRRAGPLAGFAVLFGLVAIVATGGMLVFTAIGRAPAQSDEIPLPVRSAPPLERSLYASAVYFTPMYSNAPDVGTVMDATGQRTFQLAFILAQNDACTPAWDGRQSVATDRRVAAAVDAIRDHGGDVSIAFGGGRGTRLGQACSDAASTAAAFQKVIDHYQARAIDLDLEDPEWRDNDAVTRELRAVQLVSQSTPGLYVTITLPALQSRVAARALNVLQICHEIGFVPDNFTIMPFDFGGDDPMGPAAIESLEVWHEQLMATFGWDKWDAYRHEGVSLMNGRTDQGEHFLADDFETVLRYAIDNRLGRFTYWSLNRDRQCNPVDNNGKTSGICSAVAQTPWQFTAFTARFGLAASAPSATPVPASARPSASHSPSASPSR